METEHRRIAGVAPWSRSRLWIVWEDSAESLVDLSGWIAAGRETLNLLKRPEVFDTVMVADHGTAIQWGDNQDLAIDAMHLWRLAEEQKLRRGFE
jgi:Protein of unknown function (DUF2442)